jgi:hypothetical protein
MKHFAGQNTAHARRGEVMAKKICVALVLAALVAGGLSAQVSVGLGGYLGGDFGGGYVDTRAGGVLGDTIETLKTPYFGGGGYLFFDAKYVEISLGLLGGSGEKEYINDPPVFDPIVTKTDLSYTNITMGLLLKFPKSVNRDISAFPLLGIDYLVTTRIEEKKSGNEYAYPEEYSALWFKLGGGADLSLTKKVYLRLAALYGLRLANDAEKWAVEHGWFNSNVKPRLGHGLTVKLGLGFKL